VRERERERERQRERERERERERDRQRDREKDRDRLTFYRKARFVEALKTLTLTLQLCLIKYFRTFN
jgi:hypothetical protein